MRICCVKTPASGATLVLLADNGGHHQLWAWPARYRIVRHQICPSFSHRLHVAFDKPKITHKSFLLEKASFYAAIITAKLMLMVGKKVI